MPREERIEAILAAWYDLVNCARLNAPDARTSGTRCSTKPLLAHVPAAKSYWKHLARASKITSSPAARNTKRRWTRNFANIDSTLGGRRGQQAISTASSHLTFRRVAHLGLLSLNPLFTVATLYSPSHPHPRNSAQKTEKATNIFAITYKHGILCPVAPTGGLAL